MERHTEMLIQGLRQRGHEVTVITSAFPDCSTCTQSAATHIVNLPGTSFRRYTRRWWKASRKAVSKVHQEHPVDVIWSQSIAGIGYLERPTPSVLPFVAIMHGTAAGELRARYRSFRCLPSLKGLGLVLLYLYQRQRNPRRWQAVMEYISAFIAVSHSVAEDLVHYLGAPPSRVHIVSNGVDVHCFAPRPEERMGVRRALGISAEAPLLLVAGRLVREKGIHLVIEAIRTLPEAHLAILGKGSFEASLKRITRKRGLCSRVHFLGLVPHTEMPACLNAADVFLLPSLLDEAFPLSVVEAMAVGLPVIASHVGGVPTAITDGEEGFLVPPGDVELLREKIARLLAQPEERRHMGEAARRKAVARFSVERMVEDTLSVFWTAVEQAGP